MKGRGNIVSDLLLVGIMSLATPLVAAAIIAVTQLIEPKTPAAVENRAVRRDA